MEQLFYSIQQHIATNMSVLSTIDEDYGQLQTDEDTYPVTFPCVLINAEQTDWESLSGGVQRGKCTVVITLGIDCYDDTRYGSGTDCYIAKGLKAQPDLLSGRRAGTTVFRVESKYMR